MIFCPLIILCEVNKSLIKAQHPRLLLEGTSSHSLGRDEETWGTGKRQIFVKMKKKEQKKINRERRIILITNGNYFVMMCFWK